MQIWGDIAGGDSLYVVGVCLCGEHCVMEMVHLGGAMDADRVCAVVMGSVSRNQPHFP